jgi:3-phosphoshikimate 1-carboxyvinyltransferase
VKLTIQPSPIAGALYAPASKSSMQRACALALLNEGETTIFNPGKSNDDKAALDIIKKLGATIIKKENGDLFVQGLALKDVQHFLQGIGGQINCGESGLSIRMFAPIAALSSNQIIISGEGSLLKRPMDFFDDTFPQLGVSVQTNAGKLPITIKGPLRPKDITIDGSLSSQFLTGLLFAFAKAATKPVTISVINLKSKPYIDLSLQMLKDFGYEVQNDNYQSFLITPVKQSTGKHINCVVEGDWSGAAFLLVAGAIAGSVSVKGLDVFSKQADKSILQPLMNCGAVVSVEEKQIAVSSPPGGCCQAFHFNATDCPDLFPPLVALAAYCEGTTVIEGVSRLAHKESDRAVTLQKESEKMGVDIKLQDDLMIITGGGALTGATVQSHHDHRIAMACAVAALKANGQTVIEDAGAVDKSYPEFYDHLKLLGADVSLTALTS